VSSWQYAVLCTDGGDMSAVSRSEHYARWKSYEATSLLGGFVAQIYFPCSSWRMRPAWRFAGPVGAPNTSYPVVWMSNTRDPVTPLADAQAMAAAFPGSVLFGQDADGHATLAAPSRCIARGMRAYFQSGKLPTEGMSCKPDRGMFDNYEQGRKEVGGENIDLGRAV
jgi:pimeloyl-ACP methyl ester carboxylesterase